MKKCTAVLAIPVLIICIAISACQAKGEPIFPSECRAPCWRHIQPGKTTEKELMDLLTGFADIKGDNIWRSGSQSTGESIGFILSNGVGVTIYPVDKVVVLIIFDNPNGITSFGNCIQEFDAPEFVVQSSVMGFGIPVGATSAKHTWFYALNTKNGIAYGYDTYSYFGKNTEITPKTQVTVVEFYDTGSYETLLTEGLLVNKESSAEFSEKNLHPWAGYGDIDQLYPEK